MEQKDDRENLPSRIVIQSYLLTTSKFHFDRHEKVVLLHLIEQMQPLLEGKKLRGKITLEQALWDTYYQCHIPLSDFGPDTNTKRYAEALLKLEDKKIDYWDEVEKLPQRIRIINKPKFRKGVAHFEINKELGDFFVDFSKGYSKFNAEISLNLKSVYAMRFYEIISNNSRPITYKIDTLREMFKLGSKYKLIGSFIQRIIEPSKKELDDFANWSFTYKMIKKGRKYEYIELTPVHFRERETDEQIKQDAIRRLHLSNFMETDLKNLLLKTCKFTSREIKNNLSTIQAFAKIFKDDAQNKITEIWERAQTAKNPKGYLIGVMKLEIENFIN